MGIPLYLLTPDSPLCMQGCSYVCAPVAGCMQPCSHVHAPVAARGWRQYHPLSLSTLIFETVCVSPSEPRACLLGWPKGHWDLPASTAPELGCRCALSYKCGVPNSGATCPAALLLLKTKVPTIRHSRYVSASRSSCSELLCLTMMDRAFNPAVEAVKPAI